MFTWHSYWIGIYPTQVFPCSSLTVAWHSHGWWSRRARGRRWMIYFLPWRCHGCWRGQAWGRTRWQTRNHDRNEILCVVLYPNTVFNEMWFLTVDPFIRISIFIAKLSKRQNCCRILEDFNSQEYIQFFDIHRCLLMRLHFSIGCYDCRGTSRRRQSIHFGRIQVLFADHVHWRTGVDNKFSFLWFKDLMALADTYFAKVRRMLFISFSFNFRMLLASLHAASRAHGSCHSVSSWDRSSNFGALGLRWWGSLGQIIPSDGLEC